MDAWLVIWLVIGVGLVVAEVFTTTFVLLMFGVGAFAAAATAALDGGPPLQAIAFVLATTLSFVAVRPMLRRYMRPDDRDTQMGTQAIEGSMALVLEPIDVEHGLVKIDGEMWRARPFDATQSIPVGERVRVIEIKGATAMVWKD